MFGLIKIGKRWEVSVKELLRIGGFVDAEKEDDLVTLGQMNRALYSIDTDLTGEVTSRNGVTNIAPIKVKDISNTSFPYTLTSVDKKKFLILQRTGGDSTIVVPKNTFVKGDQILFQLEGTSSIQITAASGVTLQSRDSLSTFSGRYAVASLICKDDTTDANVFSLAGDLQ